MGIEYQAKCGGDAMRLGIKGKHDSLQLWMKRVGGRQNCMIPC